MSYPLCLSFCHFPLSLAHLLHMHTCIQDVDILVVSHAAQLLDLAQFEAFGVMPRDKAVVAVKSMQVWCMCDVCVMYV
jgi:hypothetical protein